MSLKLKGGGTLNMRNWGTGELGGFSAQIIEEVIVLSSGGEVGTEDIADASFSSRVDSVTYTGGDIVPSGVTDVSFSSFTPEIATVDNSGRISRTSSGLARFSVRSRGITLALELDMTDSDLQVSLTYLGPKVGSAAAHVIDYVDSRMGSGLTLLDNARIFTTQDHALGNYVRNPNLWCADIASQLTCASPWNDTYANLRAGTAITPRHAIVAEHYPLQAGQTIRFIGVNGEVYDRLITGSARDPAYVPYTPDFRVCTLDSDLPAGIVPCKVAPSDIREYLVKNTDNRPPGIRLNQNEEAMVGDYLLPNSFSQPNDANRLLLYNPLINKDSGNPGFLVVNGELVLITVWTYGGGGGGTAVSDYHNEINAMIVAADAQAGVSTGYTITPADFSGFTNFPS